MKIGYQLSAISHQLSALAFKLEDIRNPVGVITASTLKPKADG